MSDSTGIELAAISPLRSFSSAAVHETSQPNDAVITAAPPNESALAPVDGGWGAWSFLAAAFCIEAVVSGFQDAFGVFLDAYLRDPAYASQKNATTLLPLIGSLGSGILYCSGPLVYSAVARYPAHRRKMMWGGAIVSCACLFSASYTTNIGGLITLQGIGYSLGGAVMYAPCISYLSEWFVQRRGLANGIMFAGTSVGGLFLPLILPGLIEKYGVSTTLRNLAIASSCLLLPCIPFARGRLPVSRVHGPAARSGSSAWTSLRRPSMLIAALIVLLHSFGYFVPLLWLPTYGSGQFSPKQSAASLSLLNGSAIFGRLALGIATGHFDTCLLGAFSLICASSATFVLWGVLGYTYAGLMVFAVSYGVFAGGFSSLLTGFLKPIAKDDPALTTTLFGFLLLSRGIGSVLSSPISTMLSAESKRSILEKATSGFSVAGGRYERMIIYTGACFAGAAIAALTGWGAQRWARIHT